MPLGSIPARAGKPALLCLWLGVHRVYPRTRGETKAWEPYFYETEGLSPHARGNLRRYGLPSLGFGSIPARAGKPFRSSWSFPLYGVYPRTRGETLSPGAAAPDVQGLSPHARGNLRRRGAGTTRRGSIPARAGKPRDPRRARAAEWVYPRTRGETADRDAGVVGVEGLSPHARGNPGPRVPAPVSSGSIPARAGKPRGRWRWWRCRRVYPRTRGETRTASRPAAPYKGLSPHARGNRRQRRQASRWPGSIPARAGKPAASPATRRPMWVYPRTRGETQRYGSLQSRRAGLSPHARGNPMAPAASPAPSGSIPARAGKPSASASAATGPWVYPRTRGETGRFRHRLRARRGLSPHARGNPGRTTPPYHTHGSIPARAGKPHTTQTPLPHARVYPRTRGETSISPCALTAPWGLSPHARGNRGGRRRRSRNRGSIPARAGKPRIR